ncbi:MAG: glutathione S-transferase N-terminal domain-containing protein [Saccharospirillaceae bacterium]|nr:glutathione S-transferase N-terminal domain-containing protein [Pseudomonadales bacterium]NRB81394.1 glutathione S-transferase N-terminal domain-containing protein [Saccharospirillaceae bacterium]
MKFIRVVLGALILFFNWVFTPRSIKRSSELQQQVDKNVKGFTLYQYKACPFCVKVRREIKRQAMKIPTKDAKRDQQSADELVEGGGRLKVPCLKIEEAGTVRWMYESSDIISFLQQKAA